MILRNKVDITSFKACQMTLDPFQKHPKRCSCHWPGQTWISAERVHFPSSRIIFIPKRGTGHALITWRGCGEKFCSWVLVCHWMKRGLTVSARGEHLLGDSLESIPLWLTGRSCVEPHKKMQIDGEWSVHNLLFKQIILFFFPFLLVFPTALLI